MRRSADWSSLYRENSQTKLSTPDFVVSWESPAAFAVSSFSCLAIVPFFLILSQSPPRQLYSNFIEAKFRRWRKLPRDPRVHGQICGGASPASPKPASSRSLLINVQQQINSQDSFQNTACTTDSEWHLQPVKASRSPSKDPFKHHAPEWRSGTAGVRNQTFPQPTGVRCMYLILELCRTQQQGQVGLISEQQIPSGSKLQLANFFPVHE